MTIVLDRHSTQLQHYYTLFSYYFFAFWVGILLVLLFFNPR